jgi:hypothetical protein
MKTDRRNKMYKKIKTAGMGLMLIAVLFLSACGPTAPAEPTPDIEAIRTQAIQTAAAEMTVQAALNPTATLIPATITPLPTATVGTPAPASGSGGSGGSSGGGGSSGTAIPTATPDAWRCEIVDEYPLDKPQMTGSEYDRHWVIKNIGTTTWWANDVYVEYDDTCTLCENITYQTMFYINKNVEPGDTIDIVVDIDVPTNPVALPGYTMAWNMISGNGGLICEFWNNIPSTFPAPTKTPLPD